MAFSFSSVQTKTTRLRNTRLSVCAHTGMYTD